MTLQLRTPLAVAALLLGAVPHRASAQTADVRTRESMRTGALNGLVERGFNPQAMVNGGVAMVWFPYDLYVNGAWSHCGVDVFTFVKADGKWRIASMAWSAEQPPVCEKHPSGPPSGKP